MTTTRSAPAPPRTAPPMAADGFGPPPPTRAARNVAGALLGALLIVFCAAAVAVYTARVGHRRAVLVVARPVSAGAVIQAADVGEVGVSADQALRTIPAAQRNLVVGRVAGVNLVVGTLLTVGQLATGPQSDANHAIVGLAVKAGQYPAALRAADRVLVVDTGRAGSATQSGGGPSDAIVLVDDARVTAVAPAPDGQTTMVSVLVPRGGAPAVAAAAARGAVSLILLGGSGSG
ncbi:MAG: SAF domain-containing protein [Actinomycetota bacterium]|nr:SAF domain-containing protein [Actinomycetota bacterium]